jgi:hypothetical protein
MLSTFVLGAGLALWGGGERLVLLRESMVTAFVGCWFLLSLLFRRPRIFHLAGSFTPQSNTAAYEGKWAHPYTRFVFRLMTAVWGVMLLGEAATRKVSRTSCRRRRSWPFSVFVLYGFLGVTFAWTYGYRKVAMRKVAETENKAKQSVRNLVRHD